MTGVPLAMDDAAALIALLAAEIMMATGFGFPAAAPAEPLILVHLSPPSGSAC